MPLTSFYTALTGLNTNSMAINVIGNNLANMNTVAFKAGQATFSELLGGISGTDQNGNPISLGLGSTLNGIIHNNSQGTIINTGNATDAAINGNGFFIVGDKGQMAFTRCGSFNFDSTGNLLSADGFQVMGYMGVGGVIDSSGAVTPITINKGQIIPAISTKNIGISASLDLTAEDGATLSAPVTVIDSMGASHTLTITFTKGSATRSWSWTATVPAEDTGGTSGGTPTQVGSGTLLFDNNGLLSSPDTNPTLSIQNLANGAADMNVTFNLFNESGTPTITLYDVAGDDAAGNNSCVNGTTRDGRAAGALAAIGIDNSGMIVGLTENGDSINLAQLALATFPNVEGLAKYKGSTLITYSNSGEPSVGIAGSGGRGTVYGSSLEQSNVDMAQEFVNLIRAQRAYQANSKIISISDQLYQDSLTITR